MEPADAAFPELMEGYTEAFPLEERRDRKQLEELLVKEPAMYFNAVGCGGELAGLFVYWDFGTFYYLEHLAVFAAMRNKTIGRQVLDWADRHLQGIRLLEVEPEGTGMAARRIAYYRRNGYAVLDRTYRQPAYRPGGEEFPLWIMGNDATLAPDVLQRQIRTIKNKVYYRL